MLNIIPHHIIGFVLKISCYYLFEFFIVQVQAERTKYVVRTTQVITPELTYNCEIMPVLNVKNFYYTLTAHRKHDALNDLRAAKRKQF